MCLHAGRCQPEAAARCLRQVARASPQRPLKTSGLPRISCTLLLRDCAMPGLLRRKQPSRRLGGFRQTAQEIRVRPGQFSAVSAGLNVVLVTYPDSVLGAFSRPCGTLSPVMQGKVRSRDGLKTRSPEIWRVRELALDTEASLGSNQRPKRSGTRSLRDRPRHSAPLIASLMCY